MAPPANLKIKAFNLKNPFELSDEARDIVYLPDSDLDVFFPLGGAGKNRFVVFIQNVEIISRDPIRQGAVLCELQENGTIDVVDSAFVTGWYISYTDDYTYTARSVDNSTYMFSFFRDVETYEQVAVMIVKPNGKTLSVYMHVIPRQHYEHWEESYNIDNNYLPSLSADGSRFIVSEPNYYWSRSMEILVYDSVTGELDWTQTYQFSRSDAGYDYRYIRVLAGPWPNCLLVYEKLWGTAGLDDVSGIATLTPSGVVDRYFYPTGPKSEYMNGPGHDFNNSDYGRVTRITPLEDGGPTYGSTSTLEQYIVSKSGQLTVTPEVILDFSGSGAFNYPIYTYKGLLAARDIGFTVDATNDYFVFDTYTGRKIERLDSRFYEEESNYYYWDALIFHSFDTVSEIKEGNRRAYLWGNVDATPLPMRMNQRRDGIGVTERHSRINGAMTNQWDSPGTSSRVYGNGSSAYDPKT